MRRSARLAVVALWILILCAPLAGVLTIALLPLWSWIETVSGIESVGHSGPAGWCYLAVYGACALLAAAGLAWSRRGRGAATRGAELR